MSNARRYLEGLVAEAGKSLPPHEASMLVEEARDHLDAAIQARLELGLSYEEAERESLAAFGSARAIAEDVRRREPRVDRGFFLAALGLFAFFLAIVNVGSSGPAFWAWMVPYVVLHAALIARSLKAKRPQLVVFATVLVPVWLGTAAFQATRLVTITDASYGVAVQERASIPESIRRLRKSSEAAAKAPAALVDGYTRYLRGESRLAPGRAVRFGEDWQPKLKPEPDQAAGEARWRETLARGGAFVERVGTEQLRNAELFEIAARRPWWAEMPYQIVPAAEKAALVPLVTVYGGGHLVLWTLGAAWRRRKRPNPLRRA